MPGAYEGEKWEEARKAALSRDRGVCQDCGSTADLHVHHIEPVSSFNNSIDAHYLDNLVTLCKHCHPKWEGTQRRPNALDMDGRVQLADVVHRLSEETISRHMETAGPWMLYQYFIEYIHRHSQTCDFCFSSITSGRDNVELCPSCGRCPSLWRAYRGRSVDVSDMKKRSERLAETLQFHGVPCDLASMEKAVEEKWVSDGWNGKIKKLTRLIGYVGIHRGYDPEAVDLGHSAICPIPTPTP